jgi:ABC-2 type transport system permease protein
MNNGSMNIGTTATSSKTPLNTFTWLVKREYWEHRGGFLRAPFIIALVLIAMVLMVLITADVTAHQHGVNLSGMNLGQLVEKMGPEATAKFAAGVDVSLLGMSLPIMVGLTFVVFFYLLGALYDDRRDRSVLFWKSLPISDVSTVLSKVAAALVVAPLLAIAACIALQLGFLILVSVYALLHGVNPLPLLWSPTHLIELWGKLLVFLPINALWALPTVGWLLLCSSFVRSKPFLLAVMAPAIVGVIVFWINLMQQLALPSTWYWRNIFGRLVLSIIPGGWLRGALSETDFNKSTIGQIIDGAKAVDDAGASDFLSWHLVSSALIMPDLWIGAAAGAAMIAAAIYFRQKRTEAYS